MFALVLEFGPDTETRLATRPRHREYLQKLLAEGKLIASGPWVDDTGALIIYEAADEAGARAMIAADPYTAAGVVARSQLKEWHQVFSAE
jgi:hypothetical protein